MRWRQQHDWLKEYVDIMLMNMHVLIGHMVKTEYLKELGLYKRDALDRKKCLSLICTGADDSLSVQFIWRPDTKSCSTQPSSRPAGPSGDKVLLDPVYIKSCCTQSRSSAVGPSLVQDLLDPVWVVLLDPDLVQQVLN